ncbi:MAG TPA: hypothetical protein VJZ49_15960 [Syntrophales bacterium]|nr:hypothetical protein [Syntrophales bacterium]
MADQATEKLQERIDKLEGELKLLLKGQERAREEDKALVKSIEGKVEKVEKKAEEAATRVLSGFRFKPYGYIKLDAVYDDSRTNYGNFILYVQPETTRNDDNEFNMTARQTRIGLDILAPESSNWEARGRIEIDFYGDGSVQHENKAEPLLRHAFLEMKKGGFSILAGQTFDLISPLVPDVLNYTVGWAGGNIGYRRPQLRVTNIYPLAEFSKLSMALAIARTHGTMNEDLGIGGENDGEDVGFPTVQGRLALTTKLLTKKDTVFGISGHYGKEEIDWSGTKQGRIKSWSVNGDFDLPLSDRVSVKGEIFIGSNLDDYFGGIGQGVNATTQTAIKTMGGWMQVGYQHSKKWKYNVGLGIDDPRNDDLTFGMRDRNSFYYGNVMFNLIAPVTIGLEYSYWETGYLNQCSGTDNRVQTSIIYNW